MPKYFQVSTCLYFSKQDNLRIKNHFEVFKFKRFSHISPNSDAKLQPSTSSYNPITYLNVVKVMRVYRYNQSWPFFWILKLKSEFLESKSRFWFESPSSKCFWFKITKKKCDFDLQNWSKSPKATFVEFNDM